MVVSILGAMFAGCSKPAEGDAATTEKPAATEPAKN